MKLLWLFTVLIGFGVSQYSLAASVTDWGNARPRVESKVVGKWQLVAVYEGSQNLSADSTPRDYWIFKENGWVEHFEEPHGLRRSTYWLDGRNLVVRERSGRSSRTFLVTYVDGDKMIWKHRDNGRTFTYNFARYQ
ncbi:MAG: lipocalin family protein [Ketobacteraceae bacterium]|nr:lipocalin family protein [Ketobacteraceae bacterium]